MAVNPGLPVTRLVNVSVSLSPAAPSSLDVDTLVIIGSSNVIDTTQRMRAYQTIGAIATDFGTSAPEYLAALLWFEQIPSPTNLFIARWAQTSTAAELIGGPMLTLAYTALTAITNGAFFLVENGIPLSVVGLNFSGITNLNGAATIIQTALNALSAGTTCVWNASYSTFIITSGTTDIASTLTFATPPTATGNAVFSAQPSVSDTITFNGTTVTFVASGATGNQVNIGGTLTITLASLLTFLNSSADVQIAKFHYYVVGSTLYMSAVATGAGGNALTLTKVSTNITLSGATLSGGRGTDVSTLLGLEATNSGSYVAQGVAAESAVACITLLDNQFSDQFYGLTVLGALDADVLAIAAYVEASTVTKHFYFYTTNEAGVLVASDTTNIAYQLKLLKYNHTAVQYSNTAYAAVSLAARILTTNWTANNTTITLMYKQEPGIVAETLNTTQANALDANNANVFVNYNNSTAIIQRGVCTSGQFIDTIIGLDWLSLTLQAEWYATLYESPTKIPQTDAGMHVLATVAEKVMAEAVNNGLLAPGVWNSGGFGSITQGSYLAKGYYVFQPSVNTQSQLLRQTRVAVPFQIAVKLAGAVQVIDGLISVNA